MINLVNLGEMQHFVPLIEPHDTTGADHATPVVSMREWAHASIVLFHGAQSRAAGVVTVEACSDNVPTLHPAIAFSYYRQELVFGAANCDVLGAKTLCTVPATGLIPVNVTNGAIYVIELDAADLTPGYPGFRIYQVNPAAADIMCCFAILSGGRYEGVQKATQYL